MGCFRPMKSGVSEAFVAADDPMYLPKPISGFPNAAAVRLLADLRAITARPLDRPFTDDAAVEVKAGVASACAKSLARIGRRLRQLAAAFGVPATVAELDGEVGHGADLGLAKAASSTGGATGLTSRSAQYNCGRIETRLNITLDSSLHFRPV